MGHTLESTMSSAILLTIVILLGCVVEIHSQASGINPNTLEQNLPDLIAPDTSKRADLHCSYLEALYCVKAATHTAIMTSCRDWRLVIPDMSACVKNATWGCHGLIILDWENRVAAMNESILARYNGCQIDCYQRKQKEDAVEQCRNIEGLGIYNVSDDLHFMNDTGDDFIDRYAVFYNETILDGPSNASMLCHHLRLSAGCMYNESYWCPPLHQIVLHEFIVNPLRSAFRLCGLDPTAYEVTAAPAAAINATAATPADDDLFYFSLDWWIIVIISCIVLLIINTIILIIYICTRIRRKKKEQEESEATEDSKQSRLRPHWISPKLVIDI